jgi:L-rhamnose mutarotase
MSTTTESRPLAFRMQLKQGVAAEYERRHDELWPDLAAALRKAGIFDYSIFLDEQTMSLFAVLRLRPDNRRTPCRWSR